MYQPNALFIDVPRLSAELRRLAAESARLKRALRTTWLVPMSAEQKQLVEVRRRTTRLCVLRALLRGRFHLRSAPRERPFSTAAWNQAQAHSSIAERAAQEFLRVPEPAPAGTTPL